jgi:D-glycerate 3-kinase
MGLCANALSHFPKTMNHDLDQILQMALQGDLSTATPLLVTHAQQNWPRSQALGLTLDRLLPMTQERLAIFTAVYPTIAEIGQTRLLLPMPIAELLWDFWLPLAMQLIAWHQAQSQPLIQGFLGGQGTGKTTLTTMLNLILEHLGYRTVSLSIDDLYKTASDRQRLQQQDPRLDRRGPPGTHDLDLGIQVLTALKQGQSPVQIPRFDKSLLQGSGDRTTPETIDRADIVLFEGWLVGVTPIDPVAFDHAPAPIMTATDRAFARDMNQRLREYLPLWNLLDRLIVLYVPDYRLSLPWRQQAEHAMIAQGKPGMTDQAIAEFVTYFWRSLHPELFITPLTQQPDRVDLVVEITPDHLPGQIYRPLAD